MEKIKEYPKKFWNYLKKDSWDSWLVSIILLYLIIRLVLFPLMSLLTGSPLPLVVVESCSMYHSDGIDDWWANHGAWYEERNITKEIFESYQFDEGLNKGDIILVVKKDVYKNGDIIIFRPNQESTAANPTIHRKVFDEPIASKGDNNPSQLTLYNNLYRIDETRIDSSRIIGKAVIKIPLAGWLKLIWLEPFRKDSEKGLCQENQKLNIDDGAK